MKAFRALIAGIGIGFGLWGLWLMRDFDFAQLKSMVVFLIGGVILHDAILAPITVAIGFMASRVLPGHARTAAAVAFVIWGTLTIAVFNVLSGQGGKPDNDTVLDRPYVLSWLVVTVLIAAAATIAAWSRRTRPAMG